jgi:hypothetical protein
VAQDKKITKRGSGTGYNKNNKKGAWHLSETKKQVLKAPMRLRANGSLTTENYFTIHKKFSTVL